MAAHPTRTQLRFGVLGPLVVHVDERAVHLSGAKERGVLAFLLLRANESVSADRLIEALWPSDPPATARNSLQVRISHLRKVLGAGRIASAHGYCVNANTAELDLLRFRGGVAQARRDRDEQDPTRAAEHLAEALALWRGDALPEFSDNPLFRSELGRLEEERLAAFEAWVDAELDLGHGGELVPDLEAAVSANPLREQLMGQLMVALYRAGRQAAALDAYGRARGRLVDELGLEPGPMLSDLHQRILRQDPTLSPPRRPASRVVTRPSRRNVTVVLAAFAAPAHVDVEAAERRIDEARTRAQSVLENHGAVTAPVGGGIVGTFGLPASAEDDPRRAVQAASELSEDIGLRVAIEAGVALARDSQLVDDRFVAALRRLADSARPGDVVVGPDARAALGDAAEVAGSVLVSFDPTAEAIPRHLDAPLIGRETELERLQESFRWASRNRSSHLVTILGPAGIGKSRLARELAASVAAEATLLTGRCLAHGSGAFWPLSEMVKQAAGDTTPDALLAVLPDLDDRRAVVDQLAAALGTGTGMRAEDAFWAFRKLFAALAADRPIVLVFEDLHWAEARLLDFIEELVARTEGAPMLVVALARPDLLEQRPSWGGGQLDAESIQLAPLSSESSEELIRLLGDAVPEDALGHIATRAQGNPLFIEQLVALAAEDPGAPADAIPRSIQSVLSARVDRLEPDERALLERASIIGLEFSLRGVAALSTDPTSGEESAAVARRLVRKDLLRPRGPEMRAPAEYRFGHILIRDVVYGSVLKSTRAELHERFARWLEQDLQERAGEVDEIVGYHLERSYLFRKELDPDAGGLEELANEAGERLCAAGVTEVDSSNVARGIDLLERALSLMAENNRTRGKALAQLSFAYRLKGQWVKARRSLEEGFVWIESAQDEPLRASLEVTDLQLRLHVEPTFTLEEFANASSSALERLSRSGSQRELSRVQGTLAWAYALLGRHQAASDLLEDALAIEDRGERRALLPSLWLGGPLTVQEGIRKCEALLEGQPPPRTTASCYRSLAILKAMQGDFEEARLLCRLDRRVLDELGLPVLREQRETISATVEQLADEPLLAEAVLRRAISALQRLRSTIYVAGLHAQLARSLMDQGRNDEAWTALKAARESPRNDVTHLVDAFGIEAMLLIGKDAAHQAEERARRAVMIADETDSIDLQGSARADLGRVLIGCGRKSDAEEVLADALDRFERKGNRVGATKTHGLLRALRSGKD